jgi:hypothetical protein
MEDRTGLSVADRNGRGRAPGSVSKPTGGLCLGFNFLSKSRDATGQWAQVKWNRQMLLPEEMCEQPGARSDAPDLGRWLGGG